MVECFIVVEDGTVQFCGFTQILYQKNRKDIIKNSKYSFYIDIIFIMGKFI